MERSPTSVFPLLGLPPEIRELCYEYAFEDDAVHVCDPKLHRTIGGPHRTRNRRMPGILRASKELRKDAWPVFARQAEVVFDDFFNLAQLLAAVPEDFASRVRKISLKGDAVPYPILTKFPSLQHITYSQLGNCFYAPSRDNDYNERATKASTNELIDLVMGRSPALVLLEEVSRERDLSLTVRANILSCLERASVMLDFTNRRLLQREVLAEHRFFECNRPSANPVPEEVIKTKHEARRPIIDLAQIFGFVSATGDEGDEEAEP